MKCSICNEEISNLNAFHVKKDKKLGFIDDVILCKNCWYKKRDEIAALNNYDLVVKYERLSKHFLSEKTVVLQGIVADQPQMFAWGSVPPAGASQRFIYIFPMITEKIIPISGDINEISIKENEIIMVEFDHATYLNKDNHIEVQGTFKPRVYKNAKSLGFIFKAKKVFNLTYNYSRDY